jgi:hypothetical protein
MATIEIWTYREEMFGTDEATRTADLTGFEVEALDGSIGKIDEASNVLDASYIVVDTGPWILGKKVLLPAGIITRIDTADEKVYVERTKDQIKDSPEFNADSYRDDTYRSEIEDYYGWGPRGWQGADEA